jgi:thioredoxin reductase
LRVDAELDTMVLDLDRDRNLVVTNERQGIKQYRCKAIILAMGCRERTRGALGIPGTRPAGIFTAGRAQRLMNIEGCIPGRKVVILGSGDIGMIMARRLSLEGAEVKVVAEILPYPSGLIRNEVQCLHDFHIPLRLNHTVAEIHGYRRLEGVTLVKVDEHLQPLGGTEEFVECDTLLLSVGLIPENELSKMAGVVLHPVTRGPVVDDYLETSVEGIFACGNVLHVNDMVDYVSLEGELAARGAYGRVTGKRVPRPKGIELEVGRNLNYVVPRYLTDSSGKVLSMRVTRPMGRMRIRIGDRFSKKFEFARPSEMIRLRLPPEVLTEGESSADGLEVSCEEI